MQMSKIVLLSIKPKYVKKIISGEKIYELRKKIPNVKENDIIFIYSTSPVKAIKAFAFVKNIIQGTKEDVWKKIKEKSGVSKQEYDKYFENKEVAYAIELKDIDLIARPIKLSNLRQEFDIQQPPQSYRYLNKTHFQLMKNYMIPMQLWFHFWKKDLFAYKLTRLWR